MTQWDYNLDEDTIFSFVIDPKCDPSTGQVQFLLNLILETSYKNELAYANKNL